MIEQTEKWLSRAGRGRTGSIGLIVRTWASSRVGARVSRLARLARSVRGLVGPCDEPMSTLSRVMNSMCVCIYIGHRYSSSRVMDQRSMT
jgi:hypothetical protein